MMLRLSGLFLSVVGGVVFAVWAARRPEAGAGKSGAFALTYAIISLLAAGVTYVIGHAIQAELGVAVVGPAAVLTIALVVFGVVALVAGVIKRITAGHDQAYRSTSKSNFRSSEPRRSMPGSAA